MAGSKSSTTVRTAINSILSEFCKYDEDREKWYKEKMQLQQEMNMYKKQLADKDKEYNTLQKRYKVLEMIINQKNPNKSDKGKFSNNIQSKLKRKKKNKRTVGIYATLPASLSPQKIMEWIGIEKKEEPEITDTNIKDPKKEITEINANNNINNSNNKKSNRGRKKIDRSEYINADGRYQCKLCPKSYKRYNDLKGHYAIHGKNTECCPHCAKKFSRPIYLRDHIRTHTGEKPFVCDICSKRFAAKRNLVQHRKRHFRANSRLIAIKPNNISYQISS
eukprot:500148_1